MPKFTDLKVKIYADGADPATIYRLAADPKIAGFTTNPSLMKAAGIRDYEGFAKELLAKIPDRPISLEVFSDELTEMQRQGFKLGSWGKNVYVKVPVTNSLGESTVPVIRALVSEGIQVNVTALFTLEQVRAVHEVLRTDVPSILSVFAGRIADTGRDACEVMCACRKFLGAPSNAQLLWASSREVYNIVQAEETGTDIITVSPDLLKKLPLWGKDLLELSLDTVKMFKNDAAAAGFQL